ncbi:hypothetical protein [Roseobacter sp.]|uniref:hypothetical protein n=1 Tax=Roseobacter sp. TaxID=1907202 RepID=UPI00385C105B
MAGVDPEAALVELENLLSGVFGILVSHVQISYDQYSLNSLNGFFESDGTDYFFKFHQEEGEEDMKGEYYRAELLVDAELPVDMPVWKSTLPGEQILVYARRKDRRFSDVLRQLDVSPDEIATMKAVTAERDLNSKIVKFALQTLHPVNAAEVTNEPIHHLFHERMIDLKTGKPPGGRYQDFYIDRSFEFPGCELSWEQFAHAKLSLNGQLMKSTIGEIFKSALRDLNPSNLTGAGGITAHGDAHNANVWFVDQGHHAKLSYFDPAFAGLNIPSLIAEVKATFHNVFAHPFWLYDPDVAQERYVVDAEYSGGVLSIQTDWQLNKVRENLLDAKIEAFWKPFLHELANRNMLPPNWRQTIRSAFAMCPTLVMNLRAGAGRHNVISSAIGFYVTGLAGSEPEVGRNLFTDFFDRIDPES